LILETPSFEQPAEVWGKEIEVLMKLSGSSGNLGEGSPSTKLEEGGSAADEDASRRALEAVIRASVKLAEGESGAGKSKKVVKAKAKAKGEGRKRKKGVDSEEDDEECDHD
jgi:AP endonuclease-1